MLLPDPRRPFQIPGRLRAEQNLLHARLRRSCSNGMSGDASARDDATEARSSSVSGSSSSGAARIASSTGSANARRTLRAAGTSLSGMWSTKVCSSRRSISVSKAPLSEFYCRGSAGEASRAGLVMRPQFAAEQHARCLGAWFVAPSAARNAPGVSSRIRVSCQGTARGVGLCRR